MRFEVSERIETDKPAEAVLDVAFDQFRKVSQAATQAPDSSITAKGIDATFGSINRADRTVVTAKRVEDGWLLTAEVAYRPSVMFWIFVIASFFFYVTWLFSVIFYLVQRNTVRQAVEGCLRRVSNELRRPMTAYVANRGAGRGSMDELATLADLKERGHISDEEFAAHKLRLLRAA